MPDDKANAHQERTITKTRNILQLPIDVLLIIADNLTLRSLRNVIDLFQIPHFYVWQRIETEMRQLEHMSGRLLHVFRFAHKDIYVSLYHSLPHTSLRDHSWRSLIDMILSIQRVTINYHNAVYDYASLYPSTMLFSV